MTTNTGEGSAMETAEDNGYFVVEKILDEKWDEVEKQLYYKIRWSGYDSDQDTLEPATQLAHCADILAEWEATKKARETQEGRKRSRTRSNKSGDESGSVGTPSKKRAKKTPNLRVTTSAKPPVVTSAKPPVVASDGDEDDDVSSGGTTDSYMDELKSKNEGTYKFKDVQPQHDLTDSDTDLNSIDALKDKERQRRQARRKAKQTSTLPKKRASTTTPTSATTPKTPVKRTTPSSTTPQAPHFPFGSRGSLNAIKPAKRKPGETVNTIQSDERRQKTIPKTLRGLNNLKKKQAQEPPPDTSAIATFRPDSVLTKAARTMRSGRGYENAVGDIETAISMAHSRNTSPIVEEPKAIPDNKPQEVPRVRQSSVSEAIARAAKIHDENTSKSASHSPVTPLKQFHAQSDDAETALFAEAWLKNSNAPRSPPLRRSSFSAESRSSRPAPPRLNSTGSIPQSDEISPIEPFQSPTVYVLPTLSEDGSRTWTGVLLYSKENSSLGPIRLTIPQSSVKIKQLPAFSKVSICLRSMVSVQYLSQKWFSASAHPSKKPDCLQVQFQNRDSEKKLVDIFRVTDSGGLVLGETFTLLFFFKQNDRLRNLFNNDSTSSVGVALLPALKLGDLDAPAHPSSELLEQRRMPYTGILLSGAINKMIPYYKGRPYLIHSPPDCLETIEMETILATRGAKPSVRSEDANLILIHRLYLPIMNYIPGLTDHKRSKGQGYFALFGSSLDYETVDDSVQPIFNFGLQLIFPYGGVICFTSAVLLESPQIICPLFEYLRHRSWKVVLPASMLEVIDRMEEQRGSNVRRNIGDVLCAIALIRDQIKIEKLVIEEHQLQDFGVNDYLPFMNYLQQRDYATVRRYILIHTTEVSENPWKVSGNGIEAYTPQQFEKHILHQPK